MAQRWFMFACILSLSAALGGSTPGEFRGEIVSPPSSGATSVQYIYVLGRNHLIRKVDIGNADVIYASEIPQVERSHNPKTSLVEGAEVRITAAQGAKGDWKASRVEILHMASSKTGANAAKI